MARSSRLEFAGALRQATSRGDWRKSIYDDDEDRIVFLAVLGRVVSDFSWVCPA